MKSVGETLSILLPVVLLSLVLESTSILFVLDECRTFFSVAHFGVAILVFSARVGAAFYCFNFAHAFFSTTYVRALLHLNLLGFVTFVFFTLRCHLFLILRCQLFFFINSCAFLYYFRFSYLMKPLGETLSILLPVVLLSVVLESTFNTFRPRWMPELLFRCSLRCSHSRLLCMLRCCLLLLEVGVMFNHLRSSAFSPFSSGFCHFPNFHTSRSPILHTSL